jgi:hypothetical protein
MKKDADKAAPSLLEAMHTAQTIAWGPLLFQAARVMRDRGILRALRCGAPEGMSIEHLALETNTSAYGVTVLLEAGLAARLIEKEGEKYRATRAGLLIERDEMARVNMNFVNDVCYRAAAHLDSAIEEGRATGLGELGPWSTVYEGLQELPDPAKKSWFEFDHYYSDDSFPLIMERVLGSSPTRIMDVGGNTGKFALQVLSRDPQVNITVVDLPVQIEKCRSSIDAAGFSGRTSFHPTSVLSLNAEYPRGHDLIWMSQFLCCFSEPEIVHILETAKRAMGETTRLLIMDHFWDCQKNDIASLCLQGTSLYFTVVANGNSRMYDRGTLVKCIERAGLQLVDEAHDIGWGHSILECRSC